MEFPFKKTTSIRFGHLSLEEILLFFLWPFASLIFALRQFRSPKAMTFFWLFCIYFGFAFIVPENVPGSPDSARYAARLQTLHAEPISFNQLTDMLYSGQGRVDIYEKGKLDIYEPIVTWSVSIFTGDARFLFAVFATVFGYFYTQNLWIIFSMIKTEISWIILLMILTYAMTNPIWEINGVRMWTAAHIFLYGSLRYILFEEKKGLIWAGISILVHYSFLFPFTLLVIYLFLPVNLTFLFIFYVIASFFVDANLSSIRQVLFFLPDVYHSKVNDYTTEVSSVIRTSAYNSQSWHIKFAGLSLKWVLNLWIFAAYWFRNYWIEQSSDLKRLFSYALFIGGFAHLASSLISGGRFLTISRGLFFAFFILFVHNHFQFLKKLKILKYISFPLLLFYVLFKFRLGFDYMGFSTIFGNPIFTYFFNEQTRLIDFVKQLF